MASVTILSRNMLRGTRAPGRIPAQIVPLAAMQRLAHPCRLPSLVRSAASRTGSRTFSSNSSRFIPVVAISGLLLAGLLLRDPVEAEAKPKDEAVEACLKELRARFTGDQMVEDLDSRLSRNRDSMSYFVGGTPQAVIYAESEQDVVDVVKACNKYKVPIIPWGAGTSIEGQLTPTDRGGIVIDLGKMNEIIDLHVEDLDCVVQAGKSWLDLNAEIEEHGVFFAPDPGPGASLGGMCGTSCSGTRAWRYGEIGRTQFPLKVC